MQRISNGEEVRQDFFKWRWFIENEGRKKQQFRVFLVLANDGDGDCYSFV